MASPKPDEFGRYRVQQDTGAKFSVSRPPLDGEKVLDEPASDVGGEPLPVEYPSSTPSGQKADPEKEKAHG